MRVIAVGKEMPCTIGGVLPVGGRLNPIVKGGIYPDRKLTEGGLIWKPLTPPGERLRECFGGVLVIKPEGLVATASGPRTV